jgi:hypothetical protein
MKGIKIILASSALLMILATTAQARPFLALTPVEREGLVYMRQAEKLERDVYMNLSDYWDSPLLNSIADGEQNHMDSILGLLNKYGIADPIAGLEPGEFQDPMLFQLYQTQVTQGVVSYIYALNVGAETEELSIGDLMFRMAQTNKNDIKNVYNNLRLASANHLRAFVAELARNGQIYNPQHLNPATYRIIIYGKGSVGRSHRIPSGM